MWKARPSPTHRTYIPLSSATCWQQVHVYTAGETTFWQTHFQGGKQIQISKCQIRTVWGTVHCFPTEILQQLQVCCAVCGCELSLRKITRSLGRREILSWRSFARFSARCSTCQLNLCVQFPGSPTATHHRRPLRQTRWSVLKTVTSTCRQIMSLKFLLPGWAEVLHCMVDGLLVFVKWWTHWIG